MIETFPGMGSEKATSAQVEIYPPDGLDVEFVTATGRTQAIATLKMNDVRPVEDQDLVAVRRVDQVK